MQRVALQPETFIGRLIRGKAAGALPSEIHFGGDEGAEVLQLSAAAEAKNGPRSFSMLAYTGGPLVVAGFPHPVVVDLTGLKISARSRPVLRDHTPSAIVGHTSAIENDGKRLRVDGMVSGVNAQAAEVVAAADNGFPWQVSIGARVDRAVLLDAKEATVVNGRKVTGPVIIARQSTLKEVSFVSLGADENTTARIAATLALEPDMNFASWLAARGISEDTLTAEQRKLLQASFDAEQASLNATAAAAADATPTPAGTNVNATAPAIENPKSKIENAAVDPYLAAQAAHTERIAAIRTLCDGRFPQIEAQAIRESWTTERTELAIVRAERPQTGPGIHVRGGDDRMDGQVLEAALCRRANISSERIEREFSEQTLERADARQFRGFGVQALLYEICRAAGNYVRAGQVNEDLIRTAFKSEQMLQAAGFSTVSLTGILGGTANRALIESYLAVQTVWQEICAIADHKDFKAVSSYRLDANGAFKKVGQDGELKHANLTEGTYSNQLGTFGAMLSLNRQMIYNDDLGAFLQIPRMLGRMSAIRIEEAVFVLLLSNPSSFFAVGNNNYMSGGGTALAIGSLTTAAQKFMDMVDANGKPVLTMPTKLLTGSGLRVTADNLYKETAVNEAATAGSPAINRNPHAGLYKPVSSTYVNNTSIKDQDGAAITGQSSTAWFLFADPAVRAAMQVAFLNGQQQPTIESGELDFNVLGVQFRGYHDFGVAMGDTVAAVMSAGA